MKGRGRGVVGVGRGVLRAGGDAEFGINLSTAHHLDAPFIRRAPTCLLFPA